MSPADAPTDSSYVLNEEVDRTLSACIAAEESECILSTQRNRNLSPINCVDFAIRSGNQVCRVTHLILPPHLINMEAKLNVLNRLSSHQDLVDEVYEREDRESELRLKTDESNQFNRTNQFNLFTIHEDEYEWMDHLSPFEPRIERSSLFTSDSILTNLPMETDDRLCNNSTDGEPHIIDGTCLDLNGENESLSEHTTQYTQPAKDTQTNKLTSSLIPSCETACAVRLMEETSGVVLIDSNSRANSLIDAQTTFSTTVPPALSYSTVPPVKQSSPAVPTASSEYQQTPVTVSAGPDSEFQLKVPTVCNTTHQTLPDEVRQTQSQLSSSSPTGKPCVQSCLLVQSTNNTINNQHVHRKSVDFQLADSQKATHCMLDISPSANRFQLVISPSAKQCETKSQLDISHSANRFQLAISPSAKRYETKTGKTESQDRKTLHVQDLNRESEVRQKARLNPITDDGKWGCVVYTDPVIIAWINNIDYYFERTERGLPVDLWEPFDWERAMHKYSTMPVLMVPAEQSF